MNMDIPFSIPRVIVTPSTPIYYPPFDPSDSEAATPGSPLISAGRHFRRVNLFDTPAPFDPSSNSSSSFAEEFGGLLKVPSPRQRGRQGRKGRGNRTSAVSLLFIGLAMVLVVGSALLSPAIALPRVRINYPALWKFGVKVGEAAHSHSYVPRGAGHHPTASAGGAVTFTPEIETESNAARLRFWRMYLGNKDMMLGQSGPLNTLDAWDFH